MGHKVLPPRLIIPCNEVGCCVELVKSRAGACTSHFSKLALGVVFICSPFLLQT